MEKKTKIYISGGITNVDNYQEKFNNAQCKLEKLGYSVINPAKILDGMPSDTTWDEYMELCIVMLGQSDVICMLPQWQQSSGAKIERQTAIELNKDILYI